MSTNTPTPARTPQLALAFFRGRGGWIDKAIKWRTGGEFSHVELFMRGNGVPDKEGISFSASPDDGMTRFRQIDYIGEEAKLWEVVNLPTIPSLGQAERMVSAVYRFCCSQVGKSYDWLGIMQLAAYGKLKTDDANKWYCSEICAYAVSIPEVKLLSPWCGLDPDRLYTAAEAYRQGYAAGSSHARFVFVQERG